MISPQLSLASLVIVLLWWSPETRYKQQEAQTLPWRWAPSQLPCAPHAARAHPWMKHPKAMQHLHQRASCSILGKRLMLQSIGNVGTWKGDGGFEPGRQTVQASCCVDRQRVYL